MLRIMRAQLDAFNETAYVDFELRMVAHLRRCLPERVRPLGNEGTLDLVRRGIKRAGVHGISSERGVCSFIDTMCILGEDFDTCGGFPYATAILQDGSIEDPNVRAIALLDAVLALA